jgi:hypothetical protein
MTRGSRARQSRGRGARPNVAESRPGFFRSHWNLWGEPRAFLRYVRGRAVPPENLDVPAEAG